MIGLTAIFWMFIILFGIIGAMRGWAKELLVTFSVILAMFILTVLENYVPVIGPMIKNNPETGYWVRTILLVALVFFGYQSPNISRLASTNRFVREKLQDSLLGFILGAINAYLFVGTLLWYLQQAYTGLDGNYPLPFILPPMADTPIGQAYFDLVKRLPPVWLNGVTIYIAVAIAFAFVLIVFL
jgi:uncharacterized membrane protein required for colicin V production